MDSTNPFYFVLASWFACDAPFTLALQISADHVQMDTAFPQRGDNSETS